MNFKRIHNKKTNKTNYYVDNNKVSEDKYNFKYHLCNIKRLNYNSSQQYETPCYIKSSFSMN